MAGRLTQESVEVLVTSTVILPRVRLSYYVLEVITRAPDISPPQTISSSVIIENEKFDTLVLLI